MSTETYIGDGVYASFDGYQVWLRTPREDGDHEIALEPSVFAALMEYVRRITQQAGDEDGQLGGSKAEGGT